MLKKSELSLELLELLRKLKAVEDFALSGMPESTVSVLVAAVVMSLRAEIKVFLQEDGDILDYILYQRAWAVKRAGLEGKELPVPTHGPVMRMQ